MGTPGCFATALPHLQPPYLVPDGPQFPHSMFSLSCAGGEFFLWLQTLRKHSASKVRVKMWLLSVEGVKRIRSMGLKLAGMQLTLAFFCVFLYSLHVESRPQPQALKESLSSLHPAPPREEALMLPLLLP